MVYLYLTKAHGVFPKGTVERFHPAKARKLIEAGEAEQYDPRTHSKKPTAPRLGKRVKKG